MSIDSPGVPPRVYNLLTPRSQQALNRIFGCSSNNKLDLFSIKDDINNITTNSYNTNDSVLIEECGRFLDVLQKRFEVNLDKRLSSNKYKLTDSGPFLVHVESRDKNLGNLNPISLGKLLYNGPNYLDFKITKICRKGLKRVGVYFNIPDNANDFVEKNNLDKEKFFVYIPSRMISTTGLVRDIGLDISENDMLEYGKGLNPNCKITKMRRLNKRIRTNDIVSYVPTTTCVLTFESNTLPKELVLYNTISPISVYVQPVIQCLKCLRYGHVKALCRGSFRCSKCGDSHPNEQCCEGPLNCVYCLEPHSSTDRSCKEYMRQKNIRECMAFYNITFFEANKNSKNSPTLSSSDYPNLSQNPLMQSQNSSPSPFLSSHQSFAGALKNISQSSNITSHVRRPNSVIQKRKVPTNSGFDSKAHENCLLTYKPLNTNVISLTPCPSPQLSQSSSGNHLPPKRLITPAKIQHIANLSQNSNSQKISVSRASLHSGKNIEPMDEEDIFE